MNDNEFEKRLQRQPPRQVPPAWRAEILATARQAQATSRASRLTPCAFFSTLNHQLSTLLWPHPKAWAGLAAVWVFILALNFSLRDGTPTQLAEKASPPSPEMVAELRQQRRLFAELMGPRDRDVADRPKTLTPRPRSQREEMVWMSV